jgi:hypothetical protein
MNLQMPKASAELIVMLAKPHVDKALKEGDVETAKVFQSIIATLEMAAENKLGIEFK